MSKSHKAQGSPEKADKDRHQRVTIAPKKGERHDRREIIHNPSRTLQRAMGRKSRRQ